MKPKDIGMNVMNHVKHVMLMVQKIDNDVLNVKNIIIYKYISIKNIIIAH